MLRGLELHLRVRKPVKLDIFTRLMISQILLRQISTRYAFLIVESEVKLTSTLQWGLMNFDAATLWVRQKTYLTEALDITPPFLRTKEGDAGTCSRAPRMRTLIEI